MLLRNSLKMLCIMVAITILQSLSVLGVVEKDYYKILGLDRSVSNAQIKRAYKKLSLKWHPDRNLDNYEEAREKFVDIANAYETLSDPEKRQVYNRAGIKGVQDHEQQSQQQQNVFRDQWGRMHMRQDPDEQVREDFFTGTDVKHIDFNSMDEFFRRKQVWVILFYKSNEQESKNIKDEYIQFVNKMYGIFGTGAVDCIEEEELCQEYLVFETPSVMAFSENSNDEGEKYTGEFKANKISKFASKKMTSFVSIVNSENYQSYIKREADSQKVLVFSDKKSPNPLVKTLSRLYKGKLLFGFVRKEETDLIQKFNVVKFPTIVAVTEADTYQGVQFEGETSLDKLKDFFREYAYFKKPQVQEGSKIAELTEEQYKSGTCRSSGKGFCFILFPSSSEDLQQLTESINSMTHLYIKDPLEFYFVDTQKYPDFGGNFGSPNAVMYRFQKKKYSSYTGTDYKSFIDDVLGGNGRFQRLSDQPSFTPTQEDL